MEKRLKKHFTLLTIFTPILMMYTLGALPLVTWVILFIVAEYIIVLCMKFPYSEKCKINAPLLLFFLYSFIVSLFHVLGKGGSEFDVNAFLNYHFCLCVALFLGPTWFDYKDGYLWMKRVSVFSTVYVYLQTFLFKTTQYVLSGFIPFLQTDYMESAEKVRLGVSYRPTSIFSEPAGYGTFIALFILIYINMEKKRSLPFLAFLVFGAALSQSSAGMILIAYVFSMNFLSKVVRGKLEREHLLFLAVAVIGIAILYQMGYVELVINHLFEKQNGHWIMASGLTQRVGSNEIVWNELKKSLQNLMFGVGFCETDSFLPGLIKLLYFYGLIGTIIFTVLHIILYKYSGVLGKKIIMFVLTLSLFSNGILGVQPIVFYPLIIAGWNTIPQGILLGGRCDD